jgi:hypothetical protein
MHRQESNSRRYSYDEESENDHRQYDDRRHDFDDRSEHSNQGEYSSQYHNMGDYDRGFEYERNEKSSVDRHDRNRRVGASKVDVGQQGTTPKVVWTYKNQASSPIFTGNRERSSSRNDEYDDLQGSSIGSSEGASHERMRGDLYWEHGDEWVPGHFVLDYGKLSRYSTAIAYTQQRPPLEYIDLVESYVNPVRVDLRSSRAPPPGFEHVLAIEAADGDNCSICFQSSAQQDRWLRALRAAAGGRYGQMESDWDPRAGVGERAASDSQFPPSRSRTPSIRTASGVLMTRAASLPV